MKIDIKKISQGEESVTIRYAQMTPSIQKIIGILRGEKTKLWGRVSDENVCVELDSVLYLETVDDRVFAYTSDQVVRIDGSLSSFMDEACDETFFRCSKSMVININRVASLRSMSSNRIDATMENGEHIMISRRYAVEFRKLLKGDR
ncbi:MAG: LytTR family transcriptional regulator DNA-binding domain-containing protein [Lachnospiraceae bacterium]|nr:LytTR family transcriptional regulator DNA-binding domain-containing protein [Lachnospiraceae bacterium]